MATKYRKLFNEMFFKNTTYNLMIGWLIKKFETLLTPVPRQSMVSTLLQRQSSGHVKDGLIGELAELFDNVFGILSTVSFTPLFNNDAIIDAG